MTAGNIQPHWLISTSLSSLPAQFWSITIPCWHSLPFPTSFCPFLCYCASSACASTCWFFRPSPQPISFLLLTFRYPPAQIIKWCLLCCNWTPSVQCLMLWCLASSITMWIHWWEVHHFHCFIMITLLDSQWELPNLNLSWAWTNNTNNTSGGLSSKGKLYNLTSPRMSLNHLL